MQQNYFCFCCFMNSALISARDTGSSHLYTHLPMANVQDFPSCVTSVIIVVSYSGSNLSISRFKHHSSASSYESNIMSVASSPLRMYTTRHCPFIFLGSNISPSYCIQVGHAQTVYMSVRATLGCSTIALAIVSLLSVGTKCSLFCIFHCFNVCLGTVNKERCYVFALVACFFTHYLNQTHCCND